MAHFSVDKYNYKDPGEEEYGVDEIDVDLSNHLRATALEYLSENATVGVKARIKSEIVEVADKEVKLHKIIIEKLTFINAKEK